MAGRPVRVFGELLEEPLRNGLNRPKKVRGQGVKMVNMGELFAHDRISDVTMEYVPLSDAEAERFLLRPGDLLFARQSLVLEGAGKCSVFLGASEPVTYEGHIIRARIDTTTCDPLFYYYVFQSPEGRASIVSIVEQVAAAGIRGSDLARLFVPYPRISEQRAIACILGALDDKIELNRRMNRTLEAMARAIFQSWFVDFDPVRAKLALSGAEGAAGQAPAGLKPEIAALFPDRLVEVEGREMPEGWEVKKLDELFDLAYGKALKANGRRDGAIPVYGSNGHIGWHDEKLVTGPGIVIGRKGNPGIVTWVSTDFFAIDTTFYVVQKSGFDCLHFLYFALQSQNLASLSADSAVPGLNRNIAYMNKQIMPPDLIIEQFEHQARKLLARSYQCSVESRTLSALRDTLLPKLISGVLRVADAERIVGRCV